MLIQSKRQHAVMQTHTNRPASRRWALAAATVLAGGLLALHPAHAQDAADLKSIQTQISALQAQLKRLQREAASRDAALKQAQADAAAARLAAAHAEQSSATYAAAMHGVPLTSPPGYYPPAAAAPAKPIVTVDKSGHPGINLGGITVTPGGFLDFTALSRSANLTSGTSTSYNSIPFNNSVNAHVPEFRESSQYTRFSVKATNNDTDANLGLTGYIEGDFAGAALTANSNQTNSYTPRLRQAFASVNDKLNGLELTVGQTYTLATSYKMGLSPLNEELPPVIDGNNLPGFTYLRQAGIRLVKNFGNTFFLGFSLEEPQETFSFAGESASTSTPNFTLPNGDRLSFNNLGGSFLNSTASYSYDTAPDMILKAALDTSFGHFEAYGLGRFFRSRVTPPDADGFTDTVFGGGVGGSAVIPIFPKKLDLIGNVLAGDGIGRYTPSQLPDATFSSTGKPVPLPQISGMLGLDAHPVKTLELYALAGVDTDRGSDFTIATTSKGKTTFTGYGYGTPYASDSGCETELGSCSAQTREISDLSVGTWWTAFHGGYGTMRVGLEYSFVKRVAFSGVGGRPEADENIGYFTIRYMPFDQ
jgi:hypothetical protein